MKKIAGVLAALLCVLLFSSFSPSLDGRAVVADEGVMPQGIFAKTVGYLPGDSISVTNLLTKSTVDILVIGALDPSEGVAILLSPESASLLGLEKGGNNVVKITKRSGQLDEQVSGTAVIGGGTYENPGETGEIEDEFESEKESESVLESVEEIGGPETEAVSSVGETEILEEENSPVETVETEESEEVLPFSELENEIPLESEDYPLSEEEAVSEDDFDSFAGDSEDNSGEEEVLVSEEDISERIEDDFVPETEDSENPSEPENEKDDDESPLYESVSEDELPDVASAEPFKEELYDIDEPEVSELSGAEEAEENEKDYPEEDSSESVEPESLSEIEETEEEKASETEKPERFFEEPELEELENFEDDDEFSAPETESDDESEESYEPIILVPSDMNPPERLYSSQESENENETENAAPEKDENAETLESSGKSDSDSSGGNISPGVSKNGWEDKVLESEDYLEKSKWYIQIAVLADFSNISNLVERYGEDYPLVLVPASNGKGYRILVGPLSVDEYGTVLNRFRSYGFKDAFLRKIK